MATANGNGMGDGITKVSLERRDWMAIAGMIFAIVGAAVSIMLFVFQSRAEAIQEHAAIQQMQAVDKAVAEERSKTNNKTFTNIDNTLARQDQALNIINKNVTVLMVENDIKKRNIKKLPARVPTP